MKSNSGFQISITLFFMLSTFVSFAGEGSRLTLVNGTMYDWVIDTKDADEMNSHSFPETIKAGSMETFYFEFEDNESGYSYAVYEMQGCGEKFQVKVLKEYHNVESNVFRVRVKSNTVFGDDNSDTWIDFGFHQDLLTRIMIVGESGNFMYNHGDFIESVPSNWMEKSYGIIKNKSISEMCMPGTHDSGMSTLTNPTIGSNECDTKTQTKKVAEQLDLGIRYFDVRLVAKTNNFKNFEFKMGHYNEDVEILDLNNYLSKEVVEYIDDFGGFDKFYYYSGGDGESISSMVDAVNDYTAEHKELLVLNLSHAYIVDNLVGVGTEFDTLTWNILLNQLKEDINFLHNENVPFFIQNPHRLKIEDLIHTTSKVIVLVDGVIPDELLGKGFFKKSDFELYDSYSNSYDLDFIVGDQTKKMHKSALNKTFLYNHTATMGGLKIGECVGLKLLDYLAIDIFPLSYFFIDEPNPSFSLTNVATVFNKRLLNDILPEVSPVSFPNIIGIDNVRNGDAAWLSMAINCMNSAFENQLGLTSIAPDDIFHTNSVTVSEEGKQIFTTVKDTSLLLAKINSNGDLKFWTKPYHKKGADYDAMLHYQQSKLDFNVGDYDKLLFVVEYKQRLIIAYGKDETIFIKASNADYTGWASSYSFVSSYIVEGAFPMADNLVLILEGYLMELNFEPDNIVGTYSSQLYNWDIANFVPNADRYQSIRIKEVLQYSEYVLLLVKAVDDEDKNTFHLYLLRETPVFIKSFENVIDATCSFGELYDVMNEDGNYSGSMFQVFCANENLYPGTSDKFMISVHSFTVGLTGSGSFRFSDKYIEKISEGLMFSNSGLPIYSSYVNRLDSEGEITDKKDIWLWYPATENDYLTALVFGESKYSTHIFKDELKCAVLKVPEWTVFPNPVSREQGLKVAIQSETNSNFKFDLYSSEGTAKKSFNYNVTKGYHYKTLDISGLNPGMYLLQLNSDSHFPDTKKIIIQ